MFKRIAHLFGLGRKDEAIEKRFAQIKARYGTAAREDVDLVSHVGTGIDNRVVVGSTPQTMEEVRASFLQTYMRVSAEVADETDRELAGSIR